MALQDVVKSLASTPCLRDLEPDALKLIAFSAETRILRAGDVLFQIGEPSDGGFVVLSGTITLATNAGAKATAQAPALIGDAALITETTRPCTASAREPSSVLKISRALFHRVLGEYPDSAARLRHALRSRLMVLHDDLHQFRQGIIDYTMS